MQVGAVDEVIAFAVALDEPLAAVDPIEGPAVAPMAHALVFGVVRLRFEHRMQAEVVERMRRRRAQGQPGTHLGERRCLLEHRHPLAGAQQGQGGREPSDPCADDADPRLHGPT